MISWRLVAATLAVCPAVLIVGLSPTPPAAAVGSPHGTASSSSGLPPGCVPAASGTAAGGTAAGGTAAGGTAAETSSSAQVLLAGQTSWVKPGGQFVLDLSTTAKQAGLEVYIEVFNQLGSRSDFAETLCNQIPTPLVQTFGPVPLASLTPDPTQHGAVQLPMTVDVPGASGATTARTRAGTTASRGNGAGVASSANTGTAAASGTPGDVLDLASCGTSCAGVYPVQVLLESSGGTNVLSELTTQLVLSDPATSTKRLAFAWTLGLSAPPSLSATGTPVLGHSATASLEAVAGALAARPQVPLTLAPSPITLAAMAASSDTSVHHSLSELATWAAQPSHQVLQRPFVPVTTASLVGAGLSSQLDTQLGAGASVVGSTLHVHPGTTTWVSGATLDPKALDQLAKLPGHPVRRLVVSPTDLAPVPEQSTPQVTLTPTQPFILASPAGSGSGASAAGAQIEAVTADPGLAAHLVDGPGAVLAAHQLLADLAMIYFDAPNATYERSVVLDTPTSWRPESSFLGVALSGLADSPIIQPVTLDQLFAQTPESVIQPYGGVLVRQLSASPTPVPTLPVGAIQAQRRYLAGFESVLGSERPAVLGSMQDLLLGAESTSVSPATRRGYLGDLAALIHHQLSTITLPTDTVTLTAQTARLPVTLTSALAYPITAILQLSSDKLGFLGNGSSQRVVLAQHDKTVEFEVRARATGRFPVQVTLVSPRGGFVLATSRFAVRSSAFSPVAIALTVAAGLVLASWWGRSLLRGRRRNRHLVPAAPARTS